MTRFSGLCFVFAVHSGLVSKVFHVAGMMIHSSNSNTLEDETGRRGAQVQIDLDYLSRSFFFFSFFQKKEFITVIRAYSFRGQDHGHHVGDPFT